MVYVVMQVVRLTAWAVRTVWPARWLSDQRRRWLRVRVALIGVRELPVTVKALAVKGIAALRDGEQ